MCQAGRQAGWFLGAIDPIERQHADCRHFVHIFVSRGHAIQIVFTILFHMVDSPHARARYPLISSIQKTTTWRSQLSCVKYSWTDCTVRILNKVSVKWSHTCSGKTICLLNVEAHSVKLRYGNSIAQCANILYRIVFMISKLIRAQHIIHFVCIQTMKNQQWLRCCCRHYSKAATSFTWEMYILSHLYKHISYMEWYDWNFLKHVHTQTRNGWRGTVYA